MTGDTTLTVIGNLTADPDLRFTPSGDAVSSFTVASTPRTFDRQSGEWKDGETLFLRCNIWRQAAENVAESLIMWISKRKQAPDLALSGVDMSRWRAASDGLEVSTASDQLASMSCASSGGMGSPSSRR